MKNFLSKLSLKPVLILVLSALTLGVATESSGQLVYRKAKDSVVAAGTKYVTWTSMTDGVYGIQLLTDSVSGTTSCVVTLQQRIDTIDASAWVDAVDALGDPLPTFTMAATDDGTDWLSNIWPIDLQSGNGYRLKFVSTGTQKFYIWATYLRRGRR